MAEPKKLRDVLATQVAPEFQKVAAESAATSKRMVALGHEVIRSKDASVRRALAVAQKAVDIEGDRLGALIVRMRTLLEILKKLESHPEFADNAAAIIAMTNKLDEFKNGLTDSLAFLKRYEREIGEKLKKLATLQAQSLDIRGVSADRAKASGEQFEKGHKLAVDASLKAQIEPESDPLDSELAHWNIRIVNVHANHKSATIELIDTKKAAALLDVPTTHHMKRAAALDLVSMTKELGLLAKALKRTTPGKELVALLRKAKLFERKPLAAPAFK